MSIARLIQRFKDSLSDEHSEPRQPHDPLRLATAAILLEIAHADGVLTPAEEADLVEYLRGRFQLDDDMVRRYLVRKLADLLGLEHHVMIDAKVAVLRELGLSPQP